MSNSDFPNAQNQAAGAIPVWSAPAPVGSGHTGISESGTVGASSALIVAAATFRSSMTVQNTSTNGNTLYISFNNPALATDFALAAGGALTYPYGIANALYGIGSAAGTTFAVTGA
jgi:hypothetical protein